MGVQMKKDEQQAKISSNSDGFLWIIRVSGHIGTVPAHQQQGWHRILFYTVQRSRRTIEENW